jgi:hypothetical protein
MINLVYYNPKLRVHRNGTVERWFNNKRWKIIKNSDNSRGYNDINIENKTNLSRHRLVFYCFNNFDITDSKILIDHIDGNKLNNNIDNLRVVNNAENQWNTLKRKGYCFNKKLNKFESQIYVNKKKIYLGLFSTEEEAHQAYLIAKQKYHTI